MIFRSELRTPRLSIRPFGADDASLLVALFDDPLVARWVDDGTGLSPEGAALWVQRSGENLARFGYGTGAIVERASGELVGWAGFARPEGEPEEIVYGLRHDRWGRGYAGEVVDALVGHARTLGHAEVRATVHADNAASARVLTKRGFEMRDAAYHGDPETRLFVLALT
jgi:ribosomal-protein-alanine N-acetyltransferase